MFHLLVREHGWGKGNNDLPGNRVFEPRSTRPEVILHFIPNGVFDSGAVLKHPALLVSEINGPGDQFATVVRLKSVYSSTGHIQLEWEPIPGIPKIHNTRIQTLASQLDLDPYSLVDYPELERSHWSAKDVDLFEILLRDQARPRESHVLKLSPTVDPKLVAVMMPFGGFDTVYDAIRQAAATQSLECKRADELWTNHKVMDDISELISGATVVVCDFTKRNPNVFYETGIAHALDKKFIPITQSRDDVPFDLQAYRYVHYLPNGEGLVGLTRDLSKRLGEIIK